MGLAVMRKREYKKTYGFYRSGRDAERTLYRCYGILATFSRDGKRPAGSNDRTITKCPAGSKKPGKSVIKKSKNTKGEKGNGSPF